MLRGEFESFCKEKGILPSDERYFFWLSGIQSTRNQSPVAWAALDAHGVPLAILDAINPNHGVKCVPLYTMPVGLIHKPFPSKLALDYAWGNYAGDHLGYAEFLYRYLTGP